MAERTTNVELLSMSTKTGETPQTTLSAPTGTENNVKTSTIQKISSHIFKLMNKLYKYEMGAIVGDKVPEQVKIYLDGKTGFEMEPDLRFQEYDYLSTSSIPPPFTKKTQYQWALCCWPLCCFKCCCKKFCEKNIQTKKNIELLEKTDKCCCYPSIQCCKGCNNIVGGCCCLSPTAWDFYFESNRSKVLALWNMVMCLLLLFTTLNPISPLFERSPGCENAFGYRPGVMSSLVSLPVTTNVSDLVHSPGKYCTAMNLVVSLGGLEDETKTKDMSPPATIPGHWIFSGGGHWGSCSALFASNSNGIGTSYVYRVAMLGRIFVVAAANARYNKLYGWGMVFAIAGMYNAIDNIIMSGYDLRFCPVVTPLDQSGQKMFVHGELDRLLDNRPYNGLSFSSETNYFLAKRTDPLSPAHIRNASLLLNQRASKAGKWVIPQWELFEQVERVCKHQRQTKPCTYSYESATNILKKNGFYEIDMQTQEPPVSINVTMDTLKSLKRCNYDRLFDTIKYLGNGTCECHYSRYGDKKWVIGNLTEWVHDGGIPLTFNTLDTFWRESESSTFNMLSSIMWPFPPIALTPTVSLPKSSMAVRTNPRSLSKLLEDTYDEQNAYAFRNGGYWQLINWINYFSFYFEFLLLCWIFAKGLLRSMPKARECFFKSLGKAQKAGLTSDIHQNHFSRKFSGMEDESNNKVKFKGLPTRLKASIILSIVLTFGMAWRIGGMFTHLLDGVHEMRETYRTAVTNPWDTLKPLLNYENLTTLGTNYETYVKVLKDVNGKKSSLKDEQNLFQYLTGPKGVQNSGTNGLQRLLLQHLPTSTTDLNYWVESYAINNIKNALNSTMLNTVNTSTLNNFIPMSMKQLYLGARGSFSECSQKYIIQTGENLLIEKTFGFGNDILNVVANDPNAKKLFTMTTDERSNFMTNAIKLATANSFSTCPSDLKYSMGNFSKCLANSTMTSLLEDDPTGTFDLSILIQEDQSGGACNNVTQRNILGSPYTNINGWNCGEISNTINQLQKLIFESFNRVFDSTGGDDIFDKKSSNKFCNTLESRFQSLVIQYGVNYLTNWEQLLVAQLDTVINSAKIKKILSKIPGIDANQFRDLLITTDANGNKELGSLIVFTRNQILGSKFTDREESVIDSSGLNNGLRVGATNVEEQLESINRIVNLTFSSLISGCRAGIGITVISLMFLYIMIALFGINVYTLGYYQHEVIHKLFHPTEGYVPSLKKIVCDDSNVGGDIKTFQLVDLFAMEGRVPSRKETALLNGLNSANQNLLIDTNGDGVIDEEEKVNRKKALAEVNKLIQIHIAENLQYHTVLSSSSFLATYIYMQMFGYLIYFAVLFIVLVLPFQDLFWMALIRNSVLWLPLVLLIIVKAVIQVAMVKHLEMDKGQYRGIPHPRLTTYFDFLQMMLSAIIGWAPALARIISAFLFTLILLPRLDLKLPGSGIIDTSWTKFRGIMEAWRISTEYRIVAEHAKTMKQKDDDNTKKDSGGLYSTGKRTSALFKGVESVNSNNPITNNDVEVGERKSIK